MTVPVFNLPISYGSSLLKKPRILSAKFGDGYEQRTLDGINNNLENWNISASNLKNATEADAFIAFLETQAGVIAFQWTNPNGRTALFLCKEWTRTPVSASASSITAKFEEVPA